MQARPDLHGAAGGPAPAPMLSVRDLTLALGYRTILRALRFDVAEGEVCGLFGPNGAGKTTLLKVLGLRVRPTSGRVLVRGEDAHQAGTDPRRHIGFVSHHPGFYLALSGRENLVFWGRLHRLPDVSERAGGLLERLGLKLFADDAVATYSRGMVQRLAWARTLMHEPSVLLLDEPFSSLDQGAVETVGELIASRRQAGGATVLVSHDLDLALPLISKGGLLSRGRMVHETDDPSTLLAAYRRLVTGKV